MQRLICLIFLAFLPCLSIAQHQRTSKDLQFAKYLMDKKYDDEAIFVLKGLSQQATGSLQQDSANYWLGNIYYNQQELGNSIHYFDLISNKSLRLKSEAVFFSSFNEAYLKHYIPSQQKLLAFNTQDSLQQSLKNFELAGVNLLQRKFSTFDSLVTQFNKHHYLLARQQSELIDFRNNLVLLSRKSSFKAGLLSALVPGAGKFYAGYKGQGFLNFIVAGLLGVQAWEGYRKSGPESFRFITYSTLFTTFYISTIWGSALAVKIKRNEISNTLDTQILFSMHIPIRSAFH